MPSRTGADGLGAFSYYDHVFLPESEKELTWRHAGRVFRSHVVFRINGRKTTEAYLFERAGATWRPVRLDDGTVSDGKVATYDCILAETLGSQDTFFASVFSAQQKRPLSAYKNAEIKALLGDLLGLEHIRELGAKAAEVVRGLRTALAVARQNAGSARAEVDHLDSSVLALGDVDARVEAARLAQAAATQGVEHVTRALGEAEAEAQATATIEARRAGLVKEGDRASSEREAALKRLEEEGTRVDARERALRMRVESRRRSHVDRRRALHAQQAQLGAVLGSAPRVFRAVRRVEAAERLTKARALRLAVAQRRVDEAEQLKVRRRLTCQEAAAIEGEAGHVALRQADLERRFGLTRRVPCSGTDLSGRCQLLGDAREAQALLPSAAQQMQVLRDRKQRLLEAIASVTAQLAPMADVADVRNHEEARWERADARLETLRASAARAGEMAQAEAALRVVEQELRALSPEAEETTPEEADEQRDLIAARERLAQERTRVVTTANDVMRRLKQQLAELPPRFERARVESLRRSLSDAKQVAAGAETEVLAAVRRAAERDAAMSHRAAAEARRLELDARARSVEDEITPWALLSKCLSNDGIIALDIDDAGPTISGLANDLLLACYGPRFSVEVVTQAQNARGELRENFDIVVHDGWRDESKSMKLVSGGERVWINECVTRAIALYLADNTQRRLSTLFCDEADGPLDPEHKRMFVEMKREVLKLGGYESEFFVSQTPALTAMADRVIDLDTLASVSA